MPDIQRMPLSAGDSANLKKKKDKAWFTLVRFYGTLFVGLGWAYFKMMPVAVTNEKFTVSDYRHTYYFVAAFFGIIFCYFLIDNYRKMILPLRKELAKDQKKCVSFMARKYKDPIYKNCLLFYPGNEDLYIKLSDEDFDSIPEGSDMYMETGCVTGEVLLLKAGDRIISSAEEFSFSEQVVRPETDDML